MTKQKKGKPANYGRRTPQKKISIEERGVSPVIAVILMVAITVVLAAVLYVMVTGLFDQPDPIRIGRLQFDPDDDVANKYTGTYEGSERLDSIEITVFDSSSDMTIILRPNIETTKEGLDELNITYSDNNENEHLDATDNLIIYGAEPGDKIAVIGKNSGKTIAEHVLR